MNKETIIDNIEHYSADELYRYIRQGVVTLDELKGTGRLDRSVRKKIEDLLQNGYQMVRVVIILIYFKLLCNVLSQFLLQLSFLSHKIFIRNR